MQIAGTLGLGFVLFELGIEAFLISAGLILVAFLTFWFYGRKRTVRESALLHLIARITDKPLVSGMLEAELKQIIRKRDDIVVDRFDQMVEDAAVLDIEEHMDRDEFFERTAQEMAPCMEIGTEEMIRLMKNREEQSSTVLSPFLAVPHIVIDGREKFNMLIARAEQGIRFNEEHPEIHAVFVLAGTIDERNFHLRALSAIAQVVQEEGFEKRWLSARDEQGLRDIILLSTRNRPKQGS
jgi:mannitol/fructose-specific phosphotransferase system IIA component (Ntr-type)